MDTYRITFRIPRSYDRVEPGTLSFTVEASDVETAKDMARALSHLPSGPLHMSRCTVEIEIPVTVPTEE